MSARYRGRPHLRARIAELHVAKSPGDAEGDVIDDGDNNDLLSK